METAAAAGKTLRAKEEEAAAEGAGAGASRRRRKGRSSGGGISPALSSGMESPRLQCRPPASEFKIFRFLLLGRRCRLDLQGRGREMEGERGRDG
jgi:hypothetical protein